MSTASRILLGSVVGLLLALPSARAVGRDAIIGPIPRPIPIPPDEEPPSPPAGYIYRWVPPVYHTVYDQIWVQEATQRVCQWVQIAPDRWEQVWTTVTIPAHWETVSRRQLVSPGYWELVRIEPPPPPMPLPYPAVRNAPTVGVDGYARHGGEDLSKFSPLSEWPDKK